MYGIYILQFIDILLYEFKNVFILICTHNLVPQQSNSKHLPERNNFIYRKYPTLSLRNLNKILSNKFSFANFCSIETHY